jgi:hypothetical protein
MTMSSCIAKNSFVQGRPLWPAVRRRAWGLGLGPVRFLLNASDSSRRHVNVNGSKG